AARPASSGGRKAQDHRDAGARGAVRRQGVERVRARYRNPLQHSKRFHGVSMRKTNVIAFVCFWAAQALLGLCAGAQNWTTVAATNITDLNQQKLAAGQLCFLATDQNDNPISIGVGGGGQVLLRQYCAQVTAGAISGFTVPNPANTAPTGIYYRVTAKDTSTGQEVLRYTQVTFAGTSFNFDNYAPTNQGNFAPPAG